ncbi:class I SAM-dependent methyltransferase [Aurantimonas sp. Leaf443]|uniref:class I SAM-dependent methyltransferase n=1 Tax=Aurantimonas sp. Leaf443 TaxID=1736378 RepID=UPI0006F5CC93|nr:class I SAM-dependent methyltransferase [Aurantimonas sp. Leaf443]KQT85145.1 hypothetical protein ASG48_07665 [Aurantimonas sp. Leaf443]
MSGFSPGWLALREPADHAARDAGLLARAAGHLAQVPDPVTVDLGAGTGSTLRAFADIVPARWRLVDADPVLLEEARRRHPGAETVLADLAAVDGLPLDGARLVTASALFDLVSNAFAQALARRLAAERLPLYAALTIDDAIAFAWPHPLDAALLACVAAHRHRDKGLGPALGGGATAALSAALAGHGYAVETAASPWRLGPGSEALQVAYVEGLAEAARETGAIAADAIASWLAYRRAQAEAGASCTVGHLDLLAHPL